MEELCSGDASMILYRDGMWSCCLFVRRNVWRVVNENELSPYRSDLLRSESRLSTFFSNVQLYTRLSTVATLKWFDSRVKCYYMANAC